MKRIVIVTTGGTIAMEANSVAGGAVPALGPSDLISSLPKGMADIRSEEFLKIPSAHLKIDQLWALSRRIAALLDEDSTDGVVVTHGTDTLEESAYLCDLTVNSPKPIVFTGAMRNASEVGYEGIANIAAAIQVASEASSRELGALVVFNDEIHSARDVTKTDTTMLETFRSPEWGPLGRIDAGGVVIARRPSKREFIPAQHIESSVFLLKLAVGMGTELLSHLVDMGARGIVLEGLGGGRLPNWWLPEVERAIRAGIAVVVTSRVGMGRTIDRYGYAGAHRDLVRLGCWFAEDLSGPKARIRLMAALGTTTPATYFPWN